MWNRFFKALLVAVLCAPPGAVRAAGLTLVADQRAVQWSNACVAATCTAELPMRPATADGSVMACVTELRVTAVLDGQIKVDQTVHVLSLLSGIGAARPSDFKIRNEYVLLLRPLAGTPVALPSGAELRVPGDTMVAVFEVASADLPADRRAELERVIRDTRSADAAISDDLIRDQVAAYANPHDDTEADQSEKMIYEAGPRAIPFLCARLIGKPPPPAPAAARMRQAISDLSPPPLAVQAVK